MLRELRKLYKERTNDASGFDAIGPFVDVMRETKFYPPFETITDGVNEPVCTVGGRDYLLFCANNYMSLSEHPEVKEAAKRAIDKYGIGPGGARVIAGNVDIIEALEARIADLTGTEDCLTLPTGYMANVSIFQAVLEPFILGRPSAKGDGAVFLDEYNHGSIWDGLLHTSALVFQYEHNDLETLERKLASCDRKNKLIVTEGVYSLEGEIADIPTYIDIARRHGAWLMVDDAHGIGVIGEHGGGVGEHFDCADGIDILMGCMDKAMGGTGGYLCGKKPLIDYLRLAMRSSLLSSAIPCGMAGGVIEAINHLQSDTDRRASLFDKAQYLRDALRSRRLTVLGEHNIPSLAVLIGDEDVGIAFAQALYERGIFCALVRWPAAPQGKARFRVIVMADHTYEQLDYFADSCEAVARQLGVLGEPEPVLAGT